MKKQCVFLILAVLGVSLVGATYAGSQTFTCPKIADHTFTASNSTITISGVSWSVVYPYPIAKKITLHGISTSNAVTVNPVMSPVPLVLCQAIVNTPVVLATGVNCPGTSCGYLTYKKIGTTGWKVSWPSSKSDKK